MSISAQKEVLDAVAAQLPFAVDDYSAANGVFERWVKYQNPDDRDLLLKWVFCYSRRYFITRWMLQQDLPIIGIDDCVDDVFQLCHRDIITDSGRVRKPGSFASYLSVACKNTFMNFVRRESRHPRFPMSWVGEDDLGLDGADPDLGMDRLFLHQACLNAIGRLPPTLKEAMVLRMVKDLEYDEIEVRTGKNRATLRSYVHKAVAQVRRDPEVAPLIREWGGTSPLDDL